MDPSHKQKRANLDFVEKVTHIECKPLILKLQCLELGDGADFDQMMSLAGGFQHFVDFDSEEFWYGACTWLVCFQIGDYVGALTGGG